MSCRTDVACRQLCAVCRKYVSCVGVSLCCVGTYCNLCENLSVRFICALWTCLERSRAARPKGHKREGLAGITGGRIEQIRGAFGKKRAIA